MIWKRGGRFRLRRPRLMAAALSTRAEPSAERCCGLRRGRLLLLLRAGRA
jgi:hypothetical protein